MNQNNMIPTITRRKLAKLGVYGTDCKKVLFPKNATFNFTTEKKIVEIESVRNVLPQQAIEMLVIMNNMYPIKPGSCHETAFIVAEVLSRYGVEICDGYYTSLETNEKYCHTFCKYNGKYFDPTIEFAFSFDTTKSFFYESVRTFNANEFKLYSLAIGYEDSSRLGAIGWFSSVDLDENSPYTVNSVPKAKDRLHMIDDNGKYVSIDLSEYRYV